MKSTSRLANLALQMGITPSEAVALPAVVERVAHKMGMPESELLDEMEQNAELRRYLAGVCVKVS